MWKQFGLSWFLKSQSYKTKQNFGSTFASWQWKTATTISYCLLSKFSHSNLYNINCFVFQPDLNFVRSYIIAKLLFQRHQFAAVLKHEDAESTSSGEGSNADSGRGPSEEGDPRQQHHHPDLLPPQHTTVGEYLLFSNHKTAIAILLHLPHFDNPTRQHKYYEVLMDEIFYSKTERWQHFIFDYIWKVLMSINCFHFNFTLQTDIYVISKCKLSQISAIQEN